MSKKKERREPSVVQPVIHDGILYEAPLYGAKYGFEQDGGILIARDAKSKTLLWAQKIYTIEYNEEMESDKQDVFISGMSLSADKKSLMIENESGDTFRFNLNLSKVEKLND